MRTLKALKTYTGNWHRFVPPNSVKVSIQTFPSVLSGFPRISLNYYNSNGNSLSMRFVEIDSGKFCGLIYKGPCGAEGEEKAR
jgi:hypothetical protein